MFVVRIEGLEPTRPCGHRNLNPARLPIPPYPLLFGHNLRAQCSTNLNVYEYIMKNKPDPKSGASASSATFARRTRLKT
jgi:hypothetical protein